MNGLSGGRKLTNSTRTCHAEVDAIKKMMKYKNRKRCKLLLVSICHNGDYFKNSKPCTNCCDCMMKYGITNIMWYDGKDFEKCDIESVRQSSKYSSGDRL